MLYQFPVYWDDISAYTATTSLTEITITRDIGLYGGPFKCRVVGFTYCDNLANGVAADNQDIISIRSSKFVFPLFARQGLLFTNREEHVHPGMKGQYEFVIDSIGGDIDLTFNVKQFNVNRTANTAATWNDTGFLLMILSLDIEPMEKTKAQDARMAY
jgi:hypothetical protein